LRRFGHFWRKVAWRRAVISNRAATASLDGTWLDVLVVQLLLSGLDSQGDAPKRPSEK
jgi:hypothetical protein